MKRVLIIAAHPDDEVLGCGGLISKYQSLGVDFKIIFIGEGSSCRYLDPSSNDSILDISRRKQATLSAMSFLKINNIEFYDFPCGRFDQIPIIDINKIIEKSILEFCPDTVLTHSSCDANNDHKIIFNSTVMATRPVGKNIVTRLMSYEILSTSEWAFYSTFTPNYFEIISKSDVEVKWNALALYESEIKNYPYPRSREGIKALAMIRGMQAGAKYAEAFHLIREFRQ